MAEEIQEHIEATKDNTDKVKKVTKSLRDQKTELENSIAQSKSRIATIEGIVDVSKDIKIAEKERLTTIGAVRDQVRGTGMSLVQGAEGFVTEMFGGPIGGIINTLSMGFLTRWMSNKKEESAQQKKDLKLRAEQEELLKKRVAALADTLMQDEEMAAKGREAVEEEIRAKLEKDEITALETQKKEELERSLAFMKGETENLEVKENGGESVPLDAPGGVEPSGGVVEEKLTSIEDHLNVIRMRTPTLEDLREQNRMGGEVDVPAADGAEPPKKGGGFMDMLLSPFKSFKKWIMTLVTSLGLGLKTAFASMGKTFLTTLGPQLLKVAGPLALIAGIALAVKDGIAGYFLSDEWGVSKTSAVMGSILGGTGSGWTNAFANAGKWALIGVGIGMIGGPVGMLIGGLVGAAIGGILGFIGGENLSKGFDKIGEWFTSAFDTVVDAIADVWHAVMPSWFTSIDFAWTDIFPTGLVKLFNGEYFTVDVPSFSWYSLFPNFLVEWFKGTAEKISDKPWSWTDIFPKFVVDFFTGAVAKDDYTFKWTDLFPTWLVKVLDSTAEAFDETPFTWYSLFPDWLVNIVKGVKITGGTDAFEWTDIFPGWLTKIFKAGKKAGTTEGGGFDWTKLLPDWMAGAWDSTKALGGMAKEGLSNLGDMFMESLKTLPDKLIALFNSIVSKVISIIPGFEAVTDASKYWDISDVGKKQVDTGALTKQVAGMSAEDLTKLKTSFEEEQSSTFGGLENAEAVMAIIASRAAALETEGAARGGFIVNRPAYLPKSGIVVGEHGTFTGRGAARGAVSATKTQGPVPIDGGPEAVVPLSSGRAKGFIAPIAASIAGQVMNQLTMEQKLLFGGGGTGGSSPTVIDNSSQPIITNNTIINSPEPQGPMLPGAGRDHAVSHFRHVA